jgi:hypothetical protein
MRVFTTSKCSPVFEPFSLKRHSRFQIRPIDVRKSSPIVLILAISLALSACSHPAGKCDPPKGLGELSSMKLNKATEDAASAYARGDTRLLGVYGFSVEVLGYGGDPYAHKSKIRMLEGTGDAFCTREEADIDHNARAYARKYNETMLFKLKQAGIFLDPVLDAHH